MYGQSMQSMVRRGGMSRNSGGRGAYGRRRANYRQEQVRAVQLVVCLVLFLTAFVGKGVFPGRLVRLRGEILTLISSDYDFQSGLSTLGESLMGSGTVLEGLGEFCVQVFGAVPVEEQEPAGETALLPPRPASVLAAELSFLSREPDAFTRTEHYTDPSQLGLTLQGPAEAPAETPVEAPAADQAGAPEAAVPAAGTVVLYSDYSGQPLPNNYTMDQLSLGNLETMVPVLGHLNSGYGYRDHPIDGRYQFHGGVDIGGQTGDPIAAFAAGTVEYIGEDDSYGLYLQIDHGNGVKSFYAHCSALEVSKGQQVAMGETVARVGSSGSATGPHLHLELKYGKMHLNPAYYVEFLEDR